MAGQEQDIDDLIRKNLARILTAKGIKQNAVAEMIGVKPTQISDILGGRSYIGKAIMSRLCKALDVEPHQFYITKNTPIITDERELKKIYLCREEVHLGIVDEVMAFEETRIEMAKRDTRPRQTLEEKIEILKQRRSQRRKKVA